MATRKEVEKAIETLRNLTGDDNLKAEWNSAWRGYNITSADIYGDTPFGLQIFKGDDIVAGARFALAAKNWKVTLEQRGQK